MKHAFSRSRLARALSVVFLVSQVASAAPSARLEEAHAFDVELASPPGRMHVVLRYSKPAETAITWSLSVSNPAGSILFTVEHDDAVLDSFFGDAGYMDGCVGRAACRRKWYGAELPDAVRRAFTSIDGAAGEVEQWQVDALRSQASEYLESRGVPAREITRTVDEMIRIRSGTFSSFCPPRSPVHGDACYMYVERVGYFVPYWDD